MKKTTILLFTIMAAGTFIWSSCEKTSTGPVADSSGASISFSSPEPDQSYVLQKGNKNDTLLTLKWNKPDLGFQSAPNYLIAVDTSKSDFSQAMKIANVSQTSYSITVGKMNSILLGMGLPSGQLATMNFKVTAILGDSAMLVSSKPMGLSFSPFAVCKYCPEIYMPGSYQSASGYGGDWSPADAPVLHTISGKDKYEGYVYIADENSQFKFTPERNWNNDWGDNGADGTLDPGGDNIELADAGYYKVDVDLNALTYTTTKTKWALIGNAAQGWDTDVAMSYDPSEKVWKKTLNLTAGEMKFRANGSWDINFGDGGNGTLAPGGDNIEISTAGNYTVILNLNDFPHTYMLKKN